jgi:hypothetical protein
VRDAIAIEMLSKEANNTVASARDSARMRHFCSVNYLGQLAFDTELYRVHLLDLAGRT